MAMKKNTLAALQRKLEKINKVLEDGKRQRTEIEKDIALQFAKENQKQVNAFHDAISKEHILLTPEDVKAALELVRNRKKDEQDAVAEENAKSAEKSQKSDEQPSADSDEKSKKSSDGKSDENQKNDENVSDEEDENRQKNAKNEQSHEDGKMIKSDESAKSGDDEKSEKSEEQPSAASDEKSEKSDSVETKVADVSVSSPHGAVNPEEQKNDGKGEPIQMWSPGENNYF